MILPSLFGYNAQLLYNDIVELCEQGVSHFHFDIFDESVNKTPYSGLDDAYCLKSIFNHYQITKNTHIVSRQPWRYYSSIIENEVGEVILHPDLLAESVLNDSIRFFKEHHIRIGLSHAKNCNLYSRPIIDFIHVCNYDYSSETPLSVKQVCLNIGEYNGYNKPILVDGGVNCDNISEYYATGASLFVCGRSLFSHKVMDAYSGLMKLIR